MKFEKLNIVFTHLNMNKNSKTTQLKLICFNTFSKLTKIGFAKTFFILKVKTVKSFF